MKNKELKLNALLKNYECVLNDIIYYENEGNNVSWYGIITILASALVPILKLDLVVLAALCFCIPLVQFFSLQRGINSHRYVSFLRGYASYLEDTINALLEEDYFLYNSYYIEKYIATITFSRNSKMRLSWLVMYSSNVLGLLVCYIITMINPLWQNVWYYVVTTLLFLVYLAVTLMLCGKFTQKEIVRLESRHPLNKV